MIKQQCRRWHLGIFAVMAALALGTTACREGSVAGPEVPLTRARGALSMMESNASFQAWHQGFDHGTGGWIGQDPPGAGGWCGAIEARTRGEGPVSPSAGSGYAIVRHGPCNDYWATAFPGGSGPYSPGAGYGSRWPASGLVQELDIYLDPALVGQGQNLFTLAASVHLLEEGEFHYFFTPVDGAADGSLSVNGIQVTEAGWYTFRHVFSDHGGRLRDTFELARGHRVVGSIGTYTDLTSTDVSSGYLWFVNIEGGVDLPIDEHQARRGG